MALNRLVGISRLGHQFGVTAASISAGRQVLAGIGNRYVVFGPPAGLPVESQFDPFEVKVLPRIPEEPELVEERLFDTVEVKGLTRVEVEPGEFGWDLQFHDENGHVLYVEIKLRSGQIRSSDFSHAFRRANEEASQGRQFETWFFSVDRPSLTIVGTPEHTRDQRWEVVDVWERTRTSLLRREEVRSSVEEWTHAVGRLFGFVVDALADDSTLSFQTNRSFKMSEELMQHFSVSDRELAILDVCRGEDVIASLIPRGLWVIGSYGRVDLVTPGGTTLLVRMKNGEEFQWQWVERSDRRRTHVLDTRTLRDLIR